MSSYINFNGNIIERELIYFSFPEDELIMKNFKNYIEYHEDFSQLISYKKEILDLVTQTMNDWYHDYTCNFIKIIYLKLFCVICEKIFDIIPQISSSSDVFYKTDCESLLMEYYQILRNMEIESFENNIIKVHTKYEYKEIPVREDTCKEFEKLYADFKIIKKYIADN
jgi:hypothetical protein